MEGKTGVCVAGCHGKSTTSGLVAFILKESGLDPTYLIGAEVADLGNNAAPGSGEHVVVEADEYDRAFLSYQPSVGLVLNVEPDHLDYYKTYEAVKEAFAGFVSNVEPGGTVILCANSPDAIALRDHVQEGVQVVTYALDQRAEWRAGDVEDGSVAQSFSVFRHGEQIGRFSTRLAGRHNVANALGAIVICQTLGLTLEQIAPALAKYGGVRRRFERIGEADGVLVMDDYAHHPTEVEALAVAAHARFPGRRIIALFQPHTYARTRYLLDGFRTCFRGFDRLFILETYAAREAIADGLTGEQLAAEISEPKPSYCRAFEEAAEAVAADLRRGDVFFTVGAGDLDCVGPMVFERLKSRVAPEATR
jgi:UDP-N-acetylmuramate--alanine ligase